MISFGDECGQVLDGLFRRAGFRVAGTRVIAQLRLEFVPSHPRQDLVEHGCRAAELIGCVERRLCFGTGLRTCRLRICPAWPEQPSSSWPEVTGGWRPRPRSTRWHTFPRSARQGRNRVFSHIRLASIRFVIGEPEQACLDADLALTLAEDQSSWMIRTRLHELLTDSEPYKDLPQVAELQQRVRSFT